MIAQPKRLIIAITGASGAIYGVRLLRLLKNIDGVEAHLVVSEAGELTLEHELGMGTGELALLADHSYDVNEVGAAIASGSFKNMGMIVAPCSMKTLSAIAHGYCDNLITRAADVVLKERRPAGLDDKGNATQSGSYPEHGNRDGNGRHHLPAPPCFLLPSCFYR